MMNKKIKIAVIIISLVLGFGGYFAYVKYFSQKSPAPQISDNNQLLPAENNSTSTPKQNLSGASNILPGYKLYKNADFGFEIQYPSTWVVAVEDIVNVRGENTKAFYFSPMGGSASGGKKPNGDLRFAILPRDGLSYGLPGEGASEDINIEEKIKEYTKNFRKRYIGTSIGQLTRLLEANENAEDLITRAEEWTETRSETIKNNEIVRAAGAAFAWVTFGAGKKLVWRIRGAKT